MGVLQDSYLEYLKQIGLIIKVLKSCDISMKFILNFSGAYAK